MGFQKKPGLDENEDEENIDLNPEKEKEFRKWFDSLTTEQTEALLAAHTKSSYNTLAALPIKEVKVSLEIPIILSSQVLWNCVLYSFMGLVLYRINGS